jgi:hypothetical protein
VSWSPLWHCGWDESDKVDGDDDERLTSKGGRTIMMKSKFATQEGRRERARKRMQE